MSDQPEQPEAPDGETVTTPAGAAPPVPMRVPKHGRGKLLTRGQIGNKGGGRHPERVLDQCLEICGLAADEMLLRLNNAEVRAKLSVDELRLILKEAGAFVLPKKFEHAGPMGGPIGLEVEGAREGLIKHLRERMLLLRPPSSAPSTPPPESPRGVANAVL